ncbi:DUF4368 domain-containing protein [Faecalicoccus pleomorphus]|uniref:DUF4368 domain-containing protein n=3 Tax=Bacillati TaxID=1783272 RepID=A0A3E3E701_9FIRM|nr:DUF4368 domain-containing protein [Faecalicoccus pleomorphus]
MKMAKRPVPLYDFKAFGAAIKAARNEYGESRKKVSDELYISPRYLANIENKGQQPSLQVFYDLVTRYHISVDQFFFPNSNAEKSTGRRQLDALLDGMSDKGIRIVTAKTHKVSYKSKKTRKNEEEQRYFFPNTHEPLVDEETFELAQKRIATRHRPTKAAEIDIFSGLLFCAGCRHKMYYQQGVNIEPRKFSYSCGAWRNRARTGSECTSHYIRKNVLLDLVLEDMRRVLRYVKEHEQDFICKATEYGDMEARKALAQQQKELFKAQARMTELDTLFRKLYEDNALGRLTDERFVFLTSGYEDEKKSLAARIDELQQQIATVTERKRDISRFIQIVGKYSDIQELTYENVHEFIDRILIHELDRETNTRKIEIHYSFVGQVDTEQEPTQVVNHDRRNMVDVKSIAI